MLLLVGLLGLPLLLLGLPLLLLLLQHLSQPVHLAVGEGERV